MRGNTANDPWTNIEKEKNPNDPGTQAIAVSHLCKETFVETGQDITL